jgi:hypothetical protein
MRGSVTPEYARRLISALVQTDLLDELEIETQQHQRSEIIERGSSNENIVLEVIAQAVPPKVGKNQRCRNMQ